VLLPKQIEKHVRKHFFLYDIFLAEAFCLEACPKGNQKIRTSRGFFIMHDVGSSCQNAAFQQFHQKSVRKIKFG